MSYMCSICEQPSQPGAKLKRHVIKREDGSIARELPVCADCHAGLRSGYSLERLYALCGRKMNVPEPLADRPQVAPKTANPKRSTVFSSKK